MYKMNKLIIELALNSGILNYVDHETPRHYFVSADADEECLEEYTKLIVQECVSQVAMIGVSNDDPGVMWTVDKAIQTIKQHFGVEK